MVSLSLSHLQGSVPSTGPGYLLRRPHFVHVSNRKTPTGTTSVNTTAVSSCRWGRVSPHWRHRPQHGHTGQVIQTSPVRRAVARAESDS